MADGPADESAGRLDPSSWPAMTVTLEPVSSLVPYVNNPRTHSEAEIARLAASISRYGVTMPALRDEDGVLIAGHRRILAAERLGLALFPVARADGWSEAEKRAHRVQDNSLALDSAWDDDLLRGELTDLRDLGWPLDELGFAANELDVALEDYPGEAWTTDATGPVDEPPPGKLTVTFDERHRAEVRRAVELAVDELGIEGVKVA